MNYWTDDRVEALKKMVADGLSAQMIANKLKKPSRNAIISKCHRMGLKLQGNDPEKMKSIQEQMDSKKSKINPTTHQKSLLFTSPRSKEQTEEEFNENGTGVTVEKLTPSSCRFPLWKDKEVPRVHHFCGKPVTKNRSAPGLNESYCLDHCRIAYPKKYASR